MNRPMVTTVVGVTGMGKTTKANGLVAGRDRVVFYDTLGEDFSNGVIFDDRRELGRFWQSVCRGPFRIVYRPEDPHADFAAFCEQVYEVGDMAFVVDECDSFCRNGKCVDREFTKLIGKGRHHDVDLICCTQAPKMIADFLRSQTRQWFIFSIEENAHVKYLVERFGGRITETDIRHLLQYEYLHYEKHGPDGMPVVHKCRDDLSTATTYKVLLDHAPDLQTDFREHDATV